MRFKYFLRVLLISPEFLLILVSYPLYAPAKNIIDIQQLKLLAESEVIKWICLLPISLGIFNIKTIKTSNYLKNDDKNLIVKWKNYWKLKCHLDVSFIYSIIFLLTSIFAFFIYDESNRFISIYIFSIGIIGQIILFISIHRSEDRLYEILKTQQTHFEKND